MEIANLSGDKKAGLFSITEEGPASLLLDIRSKGICAQLSPYEADLFFEKIGRLRAKIWCMTCVVKPYCLFYAIDNNEEFGVWGGLDEDERRALKDSN